MNSHHVYFFTDTDFMEVAEQLVASGTYHWNNGNVTGVVEAYADDGVLISSEFRAMGKEGNNKL